MLKDHALTGAGSRSLEGSPPHPVIHLSSTGQKHRHPSSRLAPRGQRRPGIWVEVPALVLLFHRLPALLERLRDGAVKVKQVDVGGVALPLSRDARGQVREECAAQEKAGAVKRACRPRDDAASGCSPRREVLSKLRRKRLRLAKVEVDQPGPRPAAVVRSCLRERRPASVAS